MKLNFNFNVSIVPKLSDMLTTWRVELFGSRSLIKFEVATGKWNKAYNAHLLPPWRQLHHIPGQNKVRHQQRLHQPPQMFLPFFNANQIYRCASAVSSKDKVSVCKHSWLPPIVLEYKCFTLPLKTNSIYLKRNQRSPWQGPPVNWQGVQQL